MNVIRISEVVLPDSGLSGLFMSSHSHLIFERAVARTQLTYGFTYTDYCGRPLRSFMYSIRTSALLDLTLCLNLHPGNNKVWMYEDCPVATDFRFAREKIMEVSRVSLLTLPGITNSEGPKSYGYTRYFTR